MLGDSIAVCWESGKTFIIAALLGRPTRLELELKLD
jgi:hypothetical protein